MSFVHTGLIRSCGGRTLAPHEGAGEVRSAHAENRKKDVRPADFANRAAADWAQLPEWNLSDLYAGLDDPAIKRDLDRIDAECVGFEEALRASSPPWRRRPQGGAALAAAVRRYEAIDDLMGRLGSYAGLIHAGNTVDPARTKFYGDVQERMTAASTHLLFFTLELNRVDDAVLEAAMADPALGHYRPWLDDVRRYRPYQLEDRVEQLFHEKSVTGYSAWNRQFDATIANLRFKVVRQIARHRADAEPDAGPLRRQAQGRRAGAGAVPSRTMCKTLR